MGFGSRLFGVINIRFLARKTVDIAVAIPDFLYQNYNNFNIDNICILIVIQNLIKL